MAKAEHNIKFLEKVADMKEFNDWIFSISFYSIYHACLAVLAYFGYESRNQECTFTLLEMLIGEGKITLSKDDIELIRNLGNKEDEGIKVLREQFQYGICVEAEQELVANTIQTAKTFVAKALFIP